MFFFIFKTSHFGASRPLLGPFCFIPGALFLTPLLEIVDLFCANMVLADRCGMLAHPIGQSCTFAFAACRAARRGSSSRLVLTSVARNRLVQLQVSLGLLQSEQSRSCQMFVHPDVVTLAAPVKASFHNILELVPGEFA